MGVNRSRDYDRGDGVLENQLFLIIGFEHHGVLIKTLNSTGKLHSTHEVNREESFVFARVVEKCFFRCYGV